MPLLAVMVPNAKKKRMEARYFHEQFDGTTVDPAECTCKPFFCTSSGQWAWSLTCPIDDHKAHARRAQWAATEEDQEELPPCHIAHACPARSPALTFIA